MPGASSQGLIWREGGGRGTERERGCHCSVVFLAVKEFQGLECCHCCWISMSPAVCSVLGCCVFPVALQHGTHLKTPGAWFVTCTLDGQWNDKVAVFNKDHWCKQQHIWRTEQLAVRNKPELNYTLYNLECFVWIFVFFPPFRKSLCVRTIATLIRGTT